MPFDNFSFHEAIQIGAAPTKAAPCKQSMPQTDYEEFQNIIHAAEQNSVSYIELFRNFALSVLIVDVDQKMRIEADSLII